VAQKEGLSVASMLPVPMRITAGGVDFPIKNGPCDVARVGGIRGCIPELLLTGGMPE